MILKKNEGTMSVFPFWDKCDILIGGLAYPLCPISSAQMKEILASAKTEIVGQPVYIARYLDEDQVTVWPIPSQRYYLGARWMS